MSHFNQMVFVDTALQFIGNDWSGEKVIDIGSYDVNGAIRKKFEGAIYTGVDLSEGPNVDLVMSGHEVDSPDGTYDIAISCESFEHNPKWSETFENMVRMTKQGGWVIFSCASKGRPEHGTQRTTPKSSPGSQNIGWDYYKNLTARDFKNHQIDEKFENHIFLTNHATFDLWFLGRKKGGAQSELKLADFHQELARRDSIVSAHGKYSMGSRKKTIARRTLRVLSTILPGRAFYYVSSLLKKLEK